VRHEKLLWTVLLVVLFVGGYYAIGLSQDPATARPLLTRIDLALPYAPAWMFVYGGVYTALMLPVFIVKDRRLFRHVSLAYCFTLVVSFATFLAFPVTTKGFRPEVETLDTSVFWQWGAALNYTLDPPLNSFPSLHVATMTLATLIALRVDRLMGALAVVIAIFIALSTMLVKQHYVADVVAGAALAAVAYAIFIARFDSKGLAPEELRHPRSVLLLYLGAYAFVMLGVLLPMFLNDVRPWIKAGASGTAPVSSRP
jgi:membrane-associated phospholipid phosphatase